MTVLVPAKMVSLMTVLMNANPVASSVLNVLVMLITVLNVSMPPEKISPLVPVYRDISKKITHSVLNVLINAYLVKIQETTVQNVPTPQEILFPIVSV